MVLFLVFNNTSYLSKFKEKLTDQTCNNGTKDVEITVPMK